MARKTGISLPSGQGGLIGGFADSYKTKYDFSPYFVIAFSFAVVFFIFILYQL